VGTASQKGNQGKRAGAQRVLPALEKGKKKRRRGKERDGSRPLDEKGKKTGGKKTALSS